MGLDLSYHYWHMYANKDGTCSDTGNKIRKGDKILYLPGVKGVSKSSTFCENSDTYKKNVNSIRTANKLS